MVFAASISSSWSSVDINGSQHQFRIGI